MVSATSTHPARPREYSDEERRRLFAAFQVELVKHRGRLKKLYVWVAVAIASFALLLPTQHSFVGLFPGIALVVSVAFLVCHRNKVAPRSDRYLSQYMEAGVGVESLDLYQIMRAAGQVETLLGLTAHTKFDRG